LRGFFFALAQTQDEGSVVMTPPNCLSHRGAFTLKRQGLSQAVGR
jgi:hypothetical protein